jgi:hypothetical protein
MLPPSRITPRCEGKLFPADQRLSSNREHLSIWNRMVSYLSNDEKRAREKEAVPPEEWGGFLLMSGKSLDHGHRCEAQIENGCLWKTILFL